MDMVSMEAQLGALQARVQEIENKEEIRNLRYRYHQCINDSQFDRVADLFAEDAVVEIGYLLRSVGREEIATSFKAMQNDLSFLKQFIHNHIVDVNGDEATGVSYFEAKYASLDETSLVVAGKYSEEYISTVDGWLISRMVVDLYFTTPLEKGWAIDNPHFLGAGGVIEQRKVPRPGG